VSRLPVCSGRDAAAAFARMGYLVDHQTSSHIIMRYATQRRLTVPDHKEIAKGTLRSLIREAGITKERFIELLNG
jgi:predicted RNA binding protein YcfA (HicA-like mRNA interferase family)